MSTNCKHGLDARFCSVCAPKTPRIPLRALHRSSSTGSVSQDDIVGYLNDQKIRATYGAVAEVLAVSPSQSARASAVRMIADRKPHWSSTETPLPTGYAVEQRHLALQSKIDIIRTGDDLVRRIDAWRMNATWRGGLFTGPGRSAPCAASLTPRPDTQQSQGRRTGGQPSDSRDRR